MNGLQAFYIHYCCCMLKMSLKGDVGGSALNSHGNYIVDHGKSWNNHGIVFLNFRENPVSDCQVIQASS